MSWNSEATSSKVLNKGKIDPYKSKQNQLSSNVFEQTDYSAYIPITKKEIDTNDFQAQKIKTDPVKPKTDINQFDRRDNR